MRTPALPNAPSGPDKRAVAGLPRLKIAHVYQDSSTRFDQPQAAQLHIYHTIHGLQSSGHTVALVALQGRQVLCTQDLGVFGSDKREASHYAGLGWSGTAPFKAFESGIRRLQSTLRLPYLAVFDSYRMAEAGRRNLKGYHLIHERMNLLALGGAWASRQLGIPLVLEVNADPFEQRRFKGIPERGLRRRLAVWATRICFDAAAQIICISPGLQEQLHRRWSVAERKLTVLPVAADVEAFRPAPRSARLRRRLGLTTEPVVMWVGGYYPWHDLDLLLQSFAQLLKGHPSARLVLVGDGETRPSVAQRVQAYDLHHAVIMTGAVAHNCVPEYLSIADVAVVPAAPIPASRGGTGTPLKLFEYMAAGKAVVATELNQAADVIEHGQNGLLVPPGDVHGFAEAIRGLLDNPAARDRLGQNARRLAVERYSWGQYTRQLEAIYANVLDSVAPLC